MLLFHKSFLMKGVLTLFAVSILLMGCTDEVVDEGVVDSTEYIEEAVIDNSFQDSFSSPGSSWIKGADYSSEDGEVGMMNIYTNSKKYTFRDVPVSVWNDFKNAPSKGSFYHSYIKDRYPL